MLACKLLRQLSYYFSFHSANSCVACYAVNEINVGNFALFASWTVPRKPTSQYLLRVSFLNFEIEEVDAEHENSILTVVQRTLLMPLNINGLSLILVINS